MQLTLPFAALLTTLLAFSVAPEADAHPLAQVRAPGGKITFPLQRSVRRSDVHPQINLQQHMNRAHRRYARMTGREEPSAESLARAIEKRVASVEARGLEVRSVRLGKAASNVVSGNVDLAKPVSNKQSAKFGGIIDAFGKKKKGHKSAGAAAAGAAGAGAGAAAAGAAAAGATAGSGAAANGTGSGFSEIDFQAAQSDSLTPGTTTTTNSVALDIEANDVTYVAAVQLGTPPQTFNVIMDSGSADFWVAGENCATCGQHTALGTQSSSSFKNTNTQFQVTYGSGDVQGDIVTDNVVLAGLSLPAHTFGVATAESSQFSQDPNADGLMGLAQSTLSEQGVPTPPESLAAAGLITDAITSFKLSRLADQLNDGEVTFGGLDDTKFDSATLTTLANVNTQGFWEASVDSFSVNGQDSGLTGRTAILDTGTTLIIAPPADAQAVMALVPGAKSDGQGGFTVPCTTNASIALTFGGTTFAIDPRDVAFLPVSNDLQGDCTAGISSGQIGGATEWLVGDVFLKNAYFSVDVGKNQIQLAKLT